MRQFVNDMYVRCLSASAVALSVEEKALFGHLLGSSLGRTSTETLFKQDCQFADYLQTHLSISEESVVPSIEYVDSIGAKLLPPSALHFLMLMSFNI